MMTLAATNACIKKQLGFLPKEPFGMADLDCYNLKTAAISTS